MKRSMRILFSLFLLVFSVGSAFPAWTASAAAVAATAVQAPAAAPTNTLHLRVESARQWIPSGLALHQVIPNYRWIITEDDTGDPTHYGTSLGGTDVNNSSYACKPQSIGGDPAYPANCQWPSIHSVTGGTTAQVIAEGDQSNLNMTTGINTSLWPAASSKNPNRSYMISVVAGGFDVPGCTVSATTPSCHVEGFKVDSAWFTLPLNNPGTDPGLVTVDLQPYPLPLTTVRMSVWNDIQTNGAYDTGEPYLQGWEGHIADIAGPVTDDWFGNPICTTYQHDANGLMLFDTTVGSPTYGKPLIQQIGGKCLSDANGTITIPYLGADRYSSTVVPPNGQVWYQTSTLEGWHDWDTWAIQGWNGYDPEFVQGAEPFPFAEFGFVQVQTCGQLPAQPSAGQLATCAGAASITDGTVNSSPLTGSSATTGSIKGEVVGTGAFTPGVGGLTLGGANGNYIIENINKPLISLIDTNRNDNTVYMARGNADGTFQINHVPDGDYVLSFWDEDQAYLLTQSNVSIVNGQAVDMGVLDVAAWHSRVYGKVCFDTNRNGKCDPGEQGIPGLTLSLLGRDNTAQFYGDSAATTDKDGNYMFPRAYPLGQWVVEQGYWEQYYTVGVTYQTNNQPTETTVMANGGFVDVSTFNWIGMTTRMDWAIHTYETDPTLGPINGGIVGEMVYNTTRIESDARFETSQPNEPGISNFPVHLYWPVKCDPTTGLPVTANEPFSAPNGTNCTPTTTSFGSSYYLTDKVTGEYVRGPEAQAPYISETWQRPQGCPALDANGNPVPQQVLPPATAGYDCLEAPLMSSQVGDNSVGPFMQVNGNYGFTQVITDVTGTALAAPISIPSGDWLVVPQVPTDPNSGKPLWRASMEEDVNIFSGDQLVAPGETNFAVPTPAGAAAPTIAPAIPPFPCVGPEHTVSVVNTQAAAGFDTANPSGTSGVYNPDYLAAGGNPYQGQQKPLCSAKMVTVRPGRSATPNFYWQPTSDVPLPGRIIGLVVDDLNLTPDPKNLFYGEKVGIPELPVGIYDFSDRLVKTILTDPYGVFEVNLPSTDSFNCAVPASICPGIYRFVANDPGQPGHLNPGYNPAYRTIGAFFEVWPGMTLPADLAPSPVAMGIENPNTQNTLPAACLVNDPTQATAPKVPEFYSINRPYVLSTDTGTARNFTINGQYFGTTQGAGRVTLAGVTMSIVSWSDRQIVFRVPVGFTPDGPDQLKVTSANGQSTVNGLTFHVIDSGYAPQIFSAGPGRTYNSSTDAHAIQHALDAAAAASGNGPKLVVVYPNTPSAFNPLGSYYENLILYSPVKLQGVGPGGIYADGTYMPGSVVDGLGYGTDGARETAWAATLAAVGTIIGPNGAPATDGVAAVPEGEVILAVANSTTQWTLTNGNPLPPTRQGSIDGFMIQNGDVMDFVPNVNNLGNGGQVGGGTNTPTNPNQGGGIVAFASTKNLNITNNIIRSNTGAYGGAIRIGTPLVGNNNLNGLKIANNRILNNGGSNLAGAVGIFNGAAGYEVSGNDVCGNFSAEYGGGISHFGLSAGSSIHDNRIYFNGSYDEGAGVIIAGEPPLTATGVSAGAGAVNIYNNLIQGNLAGDDGGGLRFLMAGNFPFNVYNNMIVNNISAHEGGGVAIDNAPNVRFYNNTVMKNITTATAATSNGLPAPAGLSSSENNTFFQATLPAGSPTFSNPLMFNNIFWDNRAGRWDGLNIVGIGGMVWLNGVLVPDPNPINTWDLGVPGTAFLLSTTNSILQPTANSGALASPTNRITDPLVVDSTYNVTVIGQPWRGNPNFIANTIVAMDVPVTIMGNYHLSGTASPAYNGGAASKAVPSYQQPPATLNAPVFDFDNQSRPFGGAFDIGADELH